MSSGATPSATRPPPAGGKARPAPGAVLMRYGLLLPCLVFMLVLFVWPIASMLSRAVWSPEIADNLPRTVAAMADWRGQDLPPDPVAAALAEDLAATEETKLASAGQRLNFLIPGYRTLLFKTARKMPDLGPAPTVADFAAIDKKWGDPATWIAIRKASPTLTDFYLLSALDLQRLDDGSIARAPADQAIFLGVLGRTLWISGVVTAICLVLAFPVAYTIATAAPRWRSKLTLLVLLPFWTSLLVRTSAWVILLQDTGLVNRVLLQLGLIEAPLHLIFNRTGVYIAFVHVLLPFMVLPITNAMQSIPPDYTRAAYSLGARAPRVFWKVYLPLVWPGVWSGSLLTFVICVGYYVTPLLIGGNRDQMLSYFIAFYTNQTVNWGLAAALALMMGLCLLAVLGLYGLLSRRPEFTVKG